MWPGGAFPQNMTPPPPKKKGLLFEAVIIILQVLMTSICVILHF